MKVQDSEQLARPGGDRVNGMYNHQLVTENERLSTFQNGREIKVEEMDPHYEPQAVQSDSVYYEDKAVGVKTPNDDEPYELGLPLEVIIEEQSMSSRNQYERQHSGISTPNGDEPYETMESTDDSRFFPIPSSSLHVYSPSSTDTNGCVTILRNEGETEISLAKKRQRNEKQWKCTLAKTGLNSGKEHVDRKGNTKAARQMGPGCGAACRYKCNDRVNHENRDKIFNIFWKLADHTRQWDFIIRHVKVSAKKQVLLSSIDTTKRTCSRQYFLTVDEVSIRVCKTMFLQTLGITHIWVDTALKKMDDTGAIIPDKRGKHCKRSLDNGIRESVMTHVNTYPIVASHYSRNKATKKYIESDLSIAKMHRMYLEWAKGKLEVPATERQYRDIFLNSFNISFKIPKKSIHSLMKQHTKSKSIKFTVPQI